MSATLGAAIREARERAGMSQRQLATEAGVSERAIVQWESDQVTPQRRKLYDVGRALGVEFRQYGQEWGTIGADAATGLPAGVSIDLVIDPEVWDGMTPVQQQEARAAATVAILSKLREMGLA